MTSVDARRFKRLEVQLLIVIVLLISGGVAQYVSQQRINDRVRAAALAECHRVQTRRSLGNANNFYIREAMSLLADHIIHDGQQADSLREKNRARIRAKAVRVNVTKVLYEPPVDCVQAVDNPHTYRPPKAIPFPLGYIPTH